MKKLLVTIFGAMLVLGACGGDDADDSAPPTDNGDADTEQQADDTTGDAGTYDAANGEQVYTSNCAGCHGVDLGGASGPGLVGYSYDEIMAAIEEGPGVMPAGLVSDENAEDVAAWIADQQ
ncbi:cytochrome c551/cytochrome c550 [Evansella caseinilytica]|uniref:Cytochrome c551/cytochrome c550 n=1 Tax=Evansella caseinilytica TaxID=1503961 RepID=A0A1H3S8D6_9BACI|nr:c-type cytochrome [Evansella caseinilytica]SDZ34144.1 cytochrome c551/cytochrome c550 [Evansella caseinilytica]